VKLAHRRRHPEQQLPVRDASAATALRARERLCLSNSPEYLNKEIFTSCRIRMPVIPRYHWTSRLSLAGG
jgi:hypothetical protein